MKIAGVIVLYHPDADIIKNMRSFISEIEKLYVVDNSETNDEHIRYELKTAGFNFQYIKNKQNLGVAKALNQGVEAAVQEDIEWLLTMDQDSFFFDDLFFRAVRNFSDPKGVAIFSPKSVFSLGNIQQDIEYKETNIAMTSGSLLNLSVCQKLGGFEEDLFIDEVDTEYCYKARRNGYKIILFENIYLIHQLGRPYKTKSPFTGKEFYRCEHAPSRYYYITRNRLILFSKYFFVFPGPTIRRLIRLLRLIYGIIMYESERRSKLRFILKGVYHFFIGRRGSL